MQTYANQEKQRRSVTTPDQKKQSSTFIDNRSETVEHRKLQETANKSQQARQFKALQEMANNSLQARHAAKWRAIADNHAVPQSQPAQMKANNFKVQNILEARSINRSNESPIQLASKWGSIRKGALIGSVVPVLGTAIGALIGYLWWKYKGNNAPPPGNQQGPQGAQQPQPLNIIADEEQASNGIRARPLWNFIQEVRAAIDGEDYRTAYILLTDAKRVETFNLTLTMRMQLFNPEDRPYYGENMFFIEQNRVHIASVVDPARDIMALENAAEVFSKENRKYWRPLVLGNLEEYIHAYQKASGGLVSKSTAAFRDTASTAKPNMNYDEIDILATFQEWGFNPEDSGFVNAHEEDRIPFWEWLTDQKYTRVTRNDNDQDEFADFDFTAADV